jgi:putative mRNA 3-end processing factor
VALLTWTAAGLYCPAGDFYIDPQRPVARAVITHAHADHARPGSARYLAAEEGAALLRHRLGAGIALHPLRYGAAVTLGGVRLSLHPAGHVLGSAQVRLEHQGDVWVVSGDYKTEPDPTCAPFEPLRCRVFVSEATFGLPIFRWAPQAEVLAGIHAWWQANRDQGRPSLLLAYALGKAQRVLAGLDPDQGPIALHPAMEPICRLYRAAGVPLPQTVPLQGLGVRQTNRAMILIPPGASWNAGICRAATAMVSGWMVLRGQRERRGVGAGFGLSDHADWDGLQAAVAATAAEQVLLTHGYAESLARWLSEGGRDARVLEQALGAEPAT